MSLKLPPAAVIRSMSCPVCEKKLPPGTGVDSPLYPFCSERCRNVDLFRWGTGRYAIVEPLTPAEDAEIGPMDDPARDDV